MATFFSDEQVGTWDGGPIIGSLVGQVSRNKNVVSVSGIILRLRAQSVTGQKNLIFRLKNYDNSMQLIAHDSTYSGSEPLLPFMFPVEESQKSATISWSTSDGFSGSFQITFPAPPIKPGIHVFRMPFYDTILVDYGTTSYGSPETGTITLYSDTNPDPTTVIDSNNTTDYRFFYSTGLKPSTTYYFKAVADNGVMSTASDVVSITTKKAPVFYVPVNGHARKTAKLYCSVDGVTRRVKKLYGGNKYGIAKRIL